MTRRKHGLQRGFTLIEIMVVVVIIGLMAAVVTASILPKLAQARVQKARQDIHALEGVLDLYQIDNYRLPTSEQGLAALVEKPADPALTNWSGPYVKRLSKDPWGNPYIYEIPGTHGDFDLYSLGADGKPGGEEVDADIGNWNLEQ